MLSRPYSKRRPSSREDWGVSWVFSLPESPRTSSAPITKPQLRPFACWPCQVSSSLLLLSPKTPKCPNNGGSAGPTWTPLVPSGSNRASRSQSAFCGRTPSIHRVLSWPGGLRAPGPSLTLTLPQGPPPPLGFRGLEGPSTGRKAGLARARPWGQMQTPPQPRPLHAGSSGIQPPACPPSCALRPQGTAAVCVVRTPASAALRRGPPGPSPALNAHPNLSLCREGR